MPNLAGPFPFDLSGSAPAVPSNSFARFNFPDARAFQAGLPWLRSANPGAPFTTWPDSPLSVGVGPLTGNPLGTFQNLPLIEGAGGAVTRLNAGIAPESITGAMSLAQGPAVSSGAGVGNPGLASTGANSTATPSVSSDSVTSPFSAAGQAALASLTSFGIPGLGQIGPFAGTPTANSQTAGRVGSAIGAFSGIGFPASMLTGPLAAGIMGMIDNAAGTQALTANLSNPNLSMGFNTNSAQGELGIPGQFADFGHAVTPGEQSLTLDLFSANPNSVSAAPSTGLSTITNTGMAGVSPSSAPGLPGMSPTTTAMSTARGDLSDAPQAVTDTTPTDPTTADTGGGGSGDGGASHICTALRARGLMDAETFEANQRFGRVNGRDFYRGYSVWAMPLVRFSTRRPLVFKLIYFVTAPLIRAYTREIREPGSSLAGRVILAIAVPACRLLGRALRIVSTPSAVVRV